MQRTPFPLPVCPPPHRPGSEAEQQRAFSAKLYRDFWNFSVDEASQLLEQKDPDYWERKGEQLALELFHAAAERVPAYQDFLKKNQVKHTLVKTIRDFKKIPWINKKNYLSKYILPG